MLVSSRPSSVLRWLGRALLLLVTATGVSAAADVARIEVHPVATLDATTAQLLQGDDASTFRPVTIAGELRLPSGSRTKLPAVLFLHGDAGAVANQPPWIDALVAMGIAVFTLDSFSGRQIVSASPRVGPLEGRSPGPLPRVIDAYRALDLLVRHPRIDPDRIAVIGVSSGARAALLSAVRRFADPWASRGRSFAAYVALYPPCNATLIDDTVVRPGPQRVFIGGADNVTAAEPCRRFVARLAAAGVDAAVTVYPGAYHGFDNPPGTTLFSASDVPSVAACNVEEREVAGGGDGRRETRVVNIETGMPLVDSDRCVGRGFTAGRDADADVAVRSEVGEFLRKTLAADR